MGSRGPAPTPTTILQLRGSWRGDAREGEPPADVSAPPRPDWLSPAAHAEWDRITPILLNRRTLSNADLVELAAYCQAWGEFVVAVKKVNKLDAGKTKYKGLLIDHPRVVLGRAYERLHKSAQQFGLTPASKTRLVADPEKKAETKSRFFGHAG